MDQPRMSEAEAVAPVFAFRLGEGGRYEAEDGDEEADLEDREALAETLDDGVAARIDRIGDNCIQHAERQDTSRKTRAAGNGATLGGARHCDDGNCVAHRLSVRERVGWGTSG